MSIMSKLVPDHECKQGRCGSSTTGCWGECILKIRPVALVAARELPPSEVLQIAAAHGYKHLPTVRLAYQGFHLQAFAKAIARASVQKATVWEGPIVSCYVGRGE